MKTYLDDDSANLVLVRLLRREGHDVLIPADAGNAGLEDPEHFIFAIVEGRVLLSHNHDDFELLHKLVLAAGGHHAGLLTVRKDNDRSRDLTSKGIVRAIRNLEASGVPIPDYLHVLNHWR